MIDIWLQGRTKYKALAIIVLHSYTDMPCNRNLVVKRYLQRLCCLCIVMHILNRSFMRSSPVVSVTLLPGQGQAQPVPYTGGGCPSYRVTGWACPQYISLTLFKHNHCSSFLRSNRPLPETILMSVSGVSEMHWAPGPLPSSTLPPVATREQHLPVLGSKGVEIVCNSPPFCAGCYAIH